MTASYDSDPEHQFKCAKCPNTFGRKGDLTRHQSTHTGIRPFACPFPQCGKRFAQRSGLKTHMNVHTGEKPFPCRAPGCFIAFGDPSSRSRHMKETHQDQGTHTCPVVRCGSTIKRKSAFSKHMLKRHGIVVTERDLEEWGPARVASQSTRRRRRPRQQPKTESQEELLAPKPIQLPTLPLVSTERPSPAVQAYAPIDIRVSSDPDPADVFGADLGQSPYGGSYLDSPPSLTWSTSPSPAPSSISEMLDWTSDMSLGGFDPLLDPATGVNTFFAPAQDQSDEFITLYAFSTFDTTAPYTKTVDQYWPY